MAYDNLTTGQLAAEMIDRNNRVENLMQQSMARGRELAARLAGQPIAGSETITIHDRQWWTAPGSEYGAYCAPWSLDDAGNEAARTAGLPGFVGRSKTAAALHSGTVILMIERGLAFERGRRVVVAVPGEWHRNMEGPIYGYEPRTGMLVFGSEAAKVGGEGVAEDWYVLQLPAPGLDYADSITLNPADPQHGAIITSRWPANDAMTRGYNSLRHGEYDGGTVGAPFPHRKLRELGALAHTCDWTWLAGHRDNANVLREGYLLREPNDAGSKAVEWGWFDHVPTSTARFHSQDAEPLGEYVAPDGARWRIARHRSGAANNFIMAAAPDYSARAGRRDDLHWLRWLAERGEVDLDWWHPGLAAGTEPQKGDASVRVDLFAVEMHA